MSPFLEIMPLNLSRSRRRMGTTPMGSSAPESRALLVRKSRRRPWLRPDKTQDTRPYMLQLCPRGPGLRKECVEPRPRHVLVRSSQQLFPEAPLPHPSRPQRQPSVIPRGGPRALPLPPRRVERRDDLSQNGYSLSLSVSLSLFALLWGLEKVKFHRLQLHTGLYR